jgi:DNA-binding transcriptional regulator PaaX
MVMGEQLGLLLWDVGEGLTSFAVRLWTKQSGDKGAERHLPRRLERMERRQFIVRDERAREIVYRLTQTGRQFALGGRDPSAFWNRPSDGRWYLMVFDLPVEEQAARGRLLRWLRRNGFGYLQDSVWISPNSPAEMADALRQFRDDVECFTVLEARCAVGYKDDALVRGAWNFDAINRRYQALIDYAGAHIARWKKHVPASPTVAVVGDTLRQARKLWLAAVTQDPLLPRPLWPRNYAGEEALETLRQLRDVAMNALRLPLT